MSHRRLTAMLGTGITVLTLAGCAGVGQRFDEGPYEKAKQNEPARAGQFLIEPITPQLLLKFNQAQDPAAAPQTNPALNQALHNYTYKVGVQDVLRVIVWNHPELTFPQFAISNAENSINSAYSALSAAEQENGFVVGTDGSIFFPYAGNLQVAGLSTNEIRQRLADTLATYIKNPQLDVTVVGFHSQQYQLAGVVVRPGLYPITNVPVTVSEALAAAGGAIRSLPSSATPQDAVSLSLADLAHVIVIHGSERDILNLQDFYSYGNQQQDRLVQAGDIIEVPDSSFDQVHVIGEVNKPGNYSIDNGRANLAQALGEAGGLNLITADPARIFVFRGAYEQPQVFWLDARSADTLLLATRFKLEPQDVVFVATSGLGEWSRVINDILPTVQTLYETKVLVKP